MLTSPLITIREGGGVATTREGWRGPIKEGGTETVLAMLKGAQQVMRQFQYRT